MTAAQIRYQMSVVHGQLRDLERAKRALEIKLDILRAKHENARETKGIFCAVGDEITYTGIGSTNGESLHGVVLNVEYGSGKYTPSRYIVKNHQTGKKHRVSQGRIKSAVQVEGRQEIFNTGE